MISKQQIQSRAKVWDKFTGVSRFCQNNTKMLQFCPLFIVQFVKPGCPVILNLQPNKSNP